MKTFVTALVGALSLSVVACNATPPHADAIPAVLVRPDAAARLDLQRAADYLMRHPCLTLANEALTTEPTLIIERSPLLGRETSEPEHLDLLMNADGCILVRRSTGETLRLTEADCRAAP